MAEHITSTRNPAVVDAARLHRARRRRETGLTVVEGPGVVGAAVSAGVGIQALFVLEGDGAALDLVEGAAVARTYAVTQQVLDRVADSRHPRGPVATIEIPSMPGLRARDTVACIGLSDPGNLGTIIRSAAAFGFDVAIGDGSADPWSPKVLRSAAGAHFSTGITRVGDEAVSEFRETGHRVLASVAAGGSTPALGGPGPVALLIGNEAAGLGGPVVASADEAVTIPTSSVESLNAGVAASILMYVRASDRSTEGGGS